MPPSITPSHGLTITQPTTDGTFILLLTQTKNPSKQDAETLQPIPGSSYLLPSPLQHQTQQPKTIQQFHQHLKAEQLDRWTLQIIVLQLPNDFALLRYLLFCSVGTIPISDTPVENSATSPPTNPNPTSIALLLPCAADPSVRRSTSEGTVGPPRTKLNKPASADHQSSPNTGEAPPTTAQNLTSRISKLKNFLQMN